MVFHRILVSVIGSEADDETMRLACRLLDNKGKSEIFAVCVIAVKRILPLDAEIESEINKAESALNHIEDVAVGEHCRVETDLLQAREVGLAIVEEAEEREVDLIVMGLKYKRRFGEFSLGEVVPYVLKNAHCPVILCQQYMPD